MDPPAGCRMQDFAQADHPGMHRYASPRGVPGLLDAIADRAGARIGVPTTPDDILVSAGATGGIGAVLGSILAPGDRVLILAPYWPLIDGVVRSFRGRPVPVPFLGEVDSPETAVEAVERHLDDRTVALYVSTPNNPTGRLIPRAWLEALAAWAARHDLWLISDEVYEDYAYTAPHTYLRSIAPERTFSVHSFSKAFGMAGNRCGYVVGPADTMAALVKIATHTWYSTPTASQLAAIEALRGAGDDWVARARVAYLDAGNAAADRLGVDPPDGSTFLFLDIEDALDEAGLDGFLEACVSRGLTVAPGPSFGPYPHHVRVCFTGSPPDVVARGVEVLANLLGR